jgi:hypothetical protein
MSNKIEFYKEKAKQRFEKEIEYLGSYNSDRALKIGMTKVNYFIHGLKIERKFFKLIKDKINLFRKHHSLRCTVCYNCADKLGLEQLEEFVDEYKRKNKEELNESQERRKMFQTKLNMNYNGEHVI